MLQKIRILLVEDDLSTRKLMKLILERANYEIVEAENGQSALDMLEQELIDIIILDVMMPDMNGVEVLQKIKKNPGINKIPTILCSSISDTDFVKRASALGIAGYILKPIVAKDVLDKLRNLSRSLEPALEDVGKVSIKLGISIDDYRELLQMMLEDAKSKITNLEPKIVDGDYSDFESFTRDLSSSAKNLGVNSLQKVATEVQSGLSNSEKSTGSKFLHKIRSEIERLEETVVHIR